ncbi:hypothetical protein HN018_19845 [Lichenicola cladoniae]|uniref:Uncharacterized protein n=1 Tax=Lichenicola cladoniae TaxID=1484109 RepID=A0A6M8HV08_9PROT|nr:hypothetical protein [Lichenicola cladoniae]NPD66115.1 hypothetical protein [Acetobacteraceae bacterium]QKE91987.1 hypothetical protein HN018_19845 [Lichenicola cladoniae]
MKIRLQRLQRLLAVLGVVTVPIASAMAPDVVRLSVDPEGLEKIDAFVSGHLGTFLFDSGIGVSGITRVFSGSIGCKPWGIIYRIPF